MAFTKKHIDLNYMQENKKYVFKFESTSKLDIVSAKPSCSSCTSVNILENALEVTFKPGTIPHHLQAEQAVRKTITVTHRSGAVDTLSFSGILKK